MSLGEVFPESLFGNSIPHSVSPDSAALHPGYGLRRRLPCRIRVASKLAPTKNTSDARHPRSVLHLLAKNHTATRHRPFGLLQLGYIHRHYIDTGIAQSLLRARKAR